MKPTSIVAFAIGLSLTAAFPFGSSSSPADLSGTWVIDPQRTSQVKRYHPEPGMNPRQIDPGIGCPPGIGSDGSRTDLRHKFPLVLRNGLTLVVTQTDRELRITRKAVMGQKEQTITQIFLLDGSASNNPRAKSAGTGGFAVSVI
jgi:hypothetical protein